MNRTSHQGSNAGVTRSLRPRESCGPVQEPIGLLIASARSRIKQAVLARTAIHRLPVQQFWLLIALWECPDVSQGELAKSVQLDAPTTSRVVAGLIRRRLARKDPDPCDRRFWRISLTLEGQRLAHELYGIAGQVRAAVSDGMTEAEQQALRAGLRRVIKNLERLGCT
jgi:DNA-binding MarR family transcriptional regulator